MDQEFYINNRKKIFKQMENGSVMFLFAGKDVCKSEDEEYKFTINRSFYYLTGVNEQNDILMLVKDEDGVTYDVMFINPYDEFTAKWLGRKLFPKEVSELSGIKNIKYLNEFSKVAEDFKCPDIKIYLDLHEPYFEAPILEAFDWENFFSEECVVEDCFKMLASARMVKEPCEIELIKKAIHITRLGIEEMYRHIKPNLYEYQVESYFDQQLKFHGASDFAFKTIAASGKNACTLHYQANNSLIKEGEMILFDLGAEYELYKADISRTLPANHQFSERQKIVYNIVLEGQKKVFAAIKPGKTFRDIQNVITSHFIVELKKLGLIKHDKEVNKYFFHGVSHHLGLDTHDLSLDDKPFEPGNVITVEPGLYIPEWEIGIRIEDDALVTSSGSVNLSEEIFKNIQNIESFK